MITAQDLEVPAGMRVVSKEEFFAFVGPRDIVTSNNNPNYTVWEDRSRRVVGRSLPGWENPREPSVWMLSGVKAER